jgi:hypothetical protein
MTWIERIAVDKSLQDFVAAEITRARIELATAHANADHWRAVALAKDEQLAELRTSDDRVRAGNRDRQSEHRRRTAFVPPASEGVQ